MTIWHPAIDEAGPVYLAITRALERDIERGDLQPGDRLPPHRALAKALGVNVGTVTRAYGEARRRGLVEGEVGRGTWVRERPRSVLARVERESQDGPIDLRINVPLAMPSPALSTALASLSERGDLEADLGYQDPVGSAKLRGAGQRWLARNGVRAHVDDVVVCSGAQHAILVALAATAGPGDLVLCESLTYPGFLAAARLLGLRVRGLRIDRDGIDPEALERICEQERPRALYCMPGLQNPTCAALSEPRRRRIAEIARRHDLRLVQDEIQAGLVDDDAPNLAELAAEQVLTIASLSKTLSPSIRIAFLASPPSCRRRVAEAIWGSVWMTSPIGGAIALEWLEGADAERALIERRREIDARHALANEVLGTSRFRTRPGSYHLWVPLEQGWQGRQAAETLRKRGVESSPAEEFAVDGHVSEPGVRLSLSATAGRERLREGLEIVRETLAHRPLSSTLL